MAHRGLTFLDDVSPGLGRQNHQSRMSNDVADDPSVRSGCNRYSVGRLPTGRHASLIGGGFVLPHPVDHKAGRQTSAGARDRA